MLFLLAMAGATADPPLTGTLDLGQLTRDVLAANPEVDIARAMLEQARAVAAAAGPWPDPMVDVAVAPFSFGGMPGWQVNLRQDLPLWGTRRAARDMAAADADMADAQLAMMRLDLADMAAMAWVDWYTIHRELELVAATTRVLGEVHASTLIRVAIGQASQLDALQAQAEIGWLTVEQQSLATERDGVAYQINTLRHLSLTTPVPPPPLRLLLPTSSDGGMDRPELAETAAMTRAAEAELRMVRGDRLPMLGLMAGWDAMQVMPEDRLMVGISIQLPLDQRSRAALQTAAEANIAVKRAEEARTADQVALDIAVAKRRYIGQLTTLGIVTQEILPVARARVLAARDGFAAGSTDVRPVLDAERGALDAEIRYEQALAVLHLRARELEIARGLPLPGVLP